MTDLSPLLVSGVGGPSAEHRRGPGDGATFAALLAGLLEDAGDNSAAGGGEDGPPPDAGGAVPGWSLPVPAWAGTLDPPGAATADLAALDPGDLAEVVAALLADAANLGDAARLADALAGAADASRDLDPLLARVAAEVADSLAAGGHAEAPSVDAGNADTGNGDAGNGDAGSEDAGGGDTAASAAVVAEALGRSTARVLAQLEGGRAGEVAAATIQPSSDPEKGAAGKGTAGSHPPGPEVSPRVAATAVASGAAGEMTTADGAGETAAAVPAAGAGRAVGPELVAAGRRPDLSAGHAGLVADDPAALIVAAKGRAATGEQERPVRGEAQTTTPTAAMAGGERAAGTAPVPLLGPAGGADGGAVARVMAALEQLRNAGPPRSVSLELPELDGLRLRVSLRGARTVDVRIGGRLLDDDGWLRDLGTAVASRGLELGEVDADDDAAAGRRRRRPDPPPHAGDAATGESDLTAHPTADRPGLRL